MVPSDQKPSHGFAGLEKMVSTIAAPDVPDSKNPGGSDGATQPEARTPVQAPRPVARGPATPVQAPSSFLGGWPPLAKAFAALVGVLVVIGLLNQSPSSNTPTATAPRPKTARSAPPARPVTAQQPSPRVPREQRQNTNSKSQRLAALKAHIGAGRIEISRLETWIQTLDGDLGSLERRISAYKDEIERLESNSRLGLEVNEFYYNNSVDEHNNLTRRYNRLLEDRRSAYSQYQLALAEDHRLVAAYNAMLN